MNNKKNNKNNQTRKKYRRNVKKRNSKHIKHAVGGSSYEQKGLAAQLRPSTPHNSLLRKKLNEIVHSGDFYESKDRNSFLNLDKDKQQAICYWINDDEFRDYFKCLAGDDFITSL